MLIEAVEPGSKRNAYFDLTRSKSIDALIVLNSNSEDEGVVRSIESKFPVILFGSIGHPDENSISPNTWKAAEYATRHLIALGHRRIAHITYAPLRYIGANERLKAYRRALAGARVSFDETLVAAGDFSMESGYHAMLEILGRTHRPTALFAGNDTIAVGAISALREAGRCSSDLQHQPVAGLIGDQPALLAVSRHVAHGNRDPLPDASERAE